VSLIIIAITLSILTTNCHNFWHIYTVENLHLDNIPVGHITRFVFEPPCIICWLSYVRNAVSVLWNNFRVYATTCWCRRRCGKMPTNCFIVCQVCSTLLVYLQVFSIFLSIPYTVYQSRLTDNSLSTLGVFKPVVT